MNRTEDIVAEDVSRRAHLFCEPGKPLDQTPFLRVISAGDAAVQQIASVSLALLIVVRGGLESSKFKNSSFSPHYHRYK